MKPMVPELAAEIERLMLEAGVSKPGDFILRIRDLLAHM